MHRTDLRPTLSTYLLVCALVASHATVAAADESTLNSHWRGAWVIIGTDTFSGCGGNFTNNEVRPNGARSKGEYRFRAGELGTVYKINLKRKQVEVLIELAEPLRVPRRDGPFTLYDQLGCKVELQFGLPRGASKRTEELDRLIADLLEHHDSRESAEASDRWNGRAREPYPENYDETLYEYQVWRAELVNAAVAARIDEAIEEAARLVDRVDEAPAYLAGFARGIDRARDRNLGSNCDRLLSKSIYSFVEKPPKEESRDWREGYEDGQKLFFYLEIGRRLRRCFVPAP
ncbi:MAG: hypothetical protein ACE5GX_14915 [Thermoanaerobaculia bacterium]